MSDTDHQREDAAAKWLTRGLWFACAAGILTVFTLAAALTMRWAGQAPYLENTPLVQAPVRLVPPAPPRIVPPAPVIAPVPVIRKPVPPPPPPSVAALDHPPAVPVPPRVVTPPKPAPLPQPPVPPAPAVSLFQPPPRTTGPQRPVFQQGRDVQPATLADDDVTASIDRGTTALLRLLKADLQTIKQFAGRQLPDNVQDYATGEIALGVYASLTAGRITGDPRLRFSSPELNDAVQFLLQARPTFTYAASLQASALSLLPNRPEFRKPLIAARTTLLRGTSNGIYSYETLRPVNMGDNSNTQYGQLGVWACQDAGLEIPIGYWANVNRYWRETQFSDGSWGYPARLEFRPTYPASRFNRGGAGTPTMTAAGVASLFLAKDDIDRTVSFQPRPDKNLEAGLNWLGDNFAHFKNDLPGDLYLAYGLERVALAGGIKTLGSHDWYREGAALIINAQNADGSWQYGRGSDTVGTAYAILFLSRGIAPVACAELQYNGPWNARDRDCARFVYWLDKQSERQLRWEVLPITSDPEDWRNVPMLVITGHGDPGFTADQIATLRTYVINGGMIFSSADQGDLEFSKAIKQKYAPAIFGNHYEMLALPENHPAFQIDFKIPPEKRQHLFALSNGVRDVWIHSDDDITAAWQAYATARTQDFEVPANLYFAATGQSSERPHLLPLDPPKPPPEAWHIAIAQLDYAGNSDPEPGAWPHFAADARMKSATTIQVIPTPIADLDVTKTPIAHLTGTAHFHFSPEEERKLADFFDHGGVLIADAAGGSDAFAASFKSEMAAILPKTPLLDLPADSAVYTGAMPGGAPIKELQRRRFDELGDARERPLGFLEIRRNDRPIVLFSQGDLTGGIAGLRTWGILGYSPETSTNLMWNSLVYLLNPPPAAAPIKPPA